MHNQPRYAQYTRAGTWLGLAAKQGHAEAQFYLATMYHGRLGVPQDSEEAAMWYHRAAEQGFERAYHRLAEMYYKGEGVPQDHREALKWYRKAAVSHWYNPDVNKKIRVLKERLLFEEQLNVDAQ